MRLANPHGDTGKPLGPGGRFAMKRLILTLVVAAEALAAIWFFAAAPALTGGESDGSAETSSAETSCIEDGSADSGASEAGGRGD